MNNIISNWGYFGVLNPFGTLSHALSLLSNGFVCNSTTVLATKLGERSNWGYFRCWTHQAHCHIHGVCFWLNLSLTLTVWAKNLGERSNWAYFGVLNKMSTSSYTWSLLPTYFVCNSVTVWATDLSERSILGYFGLLNTMSKFTHMWSLLSS